jgi:hypothetical protein
MMLAIGFSQMLFIRLKKDTFHMQFVAVFLLLLMGWILSNAFSAFL